MSEPGRVARPVRARRPPQPVYVPDESGMTDDISVDSDWDDDDNDDDCSIRSSDDESSGAPGAKRQKNDKYEYDGFVVSDTEEVDEDYSSEAEEELASINTSDESDESDEECGGESDEEDGEN